MEPSKCSLRDFMQILLNLGGSTFASNLDKRLAQLSGLPKKTVREYLEELSDRRRLISVRWNKLGIPIALTVLRNELPAPEFEMICNPT